MAPYEPAKCGNLGNDIDFVPAGLLFRGFIGMYLPILWRYLNLPSIKDDNGRLLQDCLQETLPGIITYRLIEVTLSRGTYALPIITSPQTSVSALKVVQANSGLIYSRIESSFSCSWGVPLDDARSLSPHQICIPGYGSYMLITTFIDSSSIGTSLCNNISVTSLYNPLLWGLVVTTLTLYVVDLLVLKDVRVSMWDQDRSEIVQVPDATAVYLLTMRGAIYLRFSTQATVRSYYAASISKVGNIPKISTNQYQIPIPYHFLSRYPCDQGPVGTGPSYWLKLVTYILSAKYDAHTHKTGSVIRLLLKSSSRSRGSQTNIEVPFSILTTLGYPCNNHPLTNGPLVQSTLPIKQQPGPSTPTTDRIYCKYLELYYWGAM
ncbi:hypothetical protein G9A89_000496, partial [Geosiphon pyriformis]